MTQHSNSLPTSEEIQDKVIETTSSPKTRHRRAYLSFIYISVATVIFAMLAFYAKTVSYFAFDLPISLSLQSLQSPYTDLIFRTISSPGYSPQIIIISSLIIVPLYYLGFRYESLTAAANAVITSTIGIVLKNLIHRSRPPIELVQVTKFLPDYSFPSGHVLFYTSFFGFIWFLSYVLLKKSIPKIILLVILGLLIVLIAPSRIFLGQHWASDTLGSYLLGSVLLLLTVSFYNWGKKRYLIRQPVAPR